MHDLASIFLDDPVGRVPVLARKEKIMKTDAVKKLVLSKESIANLTTPLVPSNVRSDSGHWYCDSNGRGN